MYSRVMSYLSTLHAIHNSESQKGRHLNCVAFLLDPPELLQAYQESPAGQRHLRACFSIDTGQRWHSKGHNRTCLQGWEREKWNKDNTNMELVGTSTKAPSFPPFHRQSKMCQRHFQERSCNGTKGGRAWWSCLMPPQKPHTIFSPCFVYYLFNAYHRTTPNYTGNVMTTCCVHYAHVTSRPGCWSSNNLRTERDMEMKLMSIDFSRRVAEGSRSS